MKCKIPVLVLMTALTPFCSVASSDGSAPRIDGIFEAIAETSPVISDEQSFRDAFGDRVVEIAPKVLQAQFGTQTYRASFGSEGWAYERKLIAAELDKLARDAVTARSAAKDAKIATLQRLLKEVPTASTAAKYSSYCGGAFFITLDANAHNYWSGYANGSIMYSEVGPAAPWSKLMWVWTEVESGGYTLSFDEEMARVSLQNGDYGRTVSAASSGGGFSCWTARATAIVGDAEPYGNAPQCTDATVFVTTQYSNC